MSTSKNSVTSIWRQYVLPKRRIFQPLHGAETLKNTAVWCRYGSTHSLVTVTHPQAKHSSHSCKHDIAYPSRNCSARNCTFVHVGPRHFAAPEQSTAIATSQDGGVVAFFSSSQLSRMKTVTFSNSLIQLRHSLIQAHCQVAQTTCFWPKLMTCCAYSRVSIVFLEILSCPFDSPSAAANYVVQLLWCPARVWRSYQVWWELVNWSKRWHMSNCEPITLLYFPKKYQHYWWCRT